MADKKKAPGRSKGAAARAPAKRAKLPQKLAKKSSKSKSLKKIAKKSAQIKSKPAKRAAKPASKRVAGRAAPARAGAKRGAAKRIVAKRTLAKKPAIRGPVPRKTPPRSIAARRAAPTGGPRGPAAARPKAPAKPATPPPAAAPAAKTIAPKPAVAPKPSAIVPPPTGTAALARPVVVKPAAPKPPVARPAVPIRPAVVAPKTGIKVTGRAGPGYEQILSTAAMDFIVGLERRFRPEYKRLLHLREERQRRLDAGEKPDFLPETVNIRNGDWTAAPVPRDLQDRRVEITGPPERKTAINALNSGANCYMADFADACSPTWSNLMDGQINLRDAVAGTISFKDPGSAKEPGSGKDYRLNPQHAVLIVRPRGWHLPERHVVVDGEPMAGALFDFGLYFFHNARPLIRNGSGPYFYLPKLESHLEARLWNDVFLHAQRAFGLPRGTIKATILIETILAAFEMDEILYELRDHAAGLNVGRWDYLFSFVKKFRTDRSKVLPDRTKVTMAAPFMRAYSQLLIKTCHRREVHAMGAMAAQAPIRESAAANQDALDKVRQDKDREAGEGHDGTWVAHPALVPLVKAVFDKAMPQANQVARKRPDVQVTAADLLQAPTGTRTEAGLRQNLAVGIGYIEAWLRGEGCVKLFNLMEDAATAEIARVQIWQWLKYGSKLDDGKPITAELVRRLIAEEVAKARTARDKLSGGKRDGDRFDDAAALFQRLVEAPDCADFLTLAAYELLAD